MTFLPISPVIDTIMDGVVRFVAAAFLSFIAGIGLAMGMMTVELSYQAATERQAVTVEKLQDRVAMQPN